MTMSPLEKCSEYGKDGDLTGADHEHTETSMLTLHLLQPALVHVNALLLQRVLEIAEWAQLLGEADRRGLAPLLWSHIDLYGRFRLDMEYPPRPSRPDRLRSRGAVVHANA
jgi:hypothetical protein